MHAYVSQVHAAMQAKTTTLKIYTGRERTSAYYNPNNAPPTLLSNSNDQHLLIIYNGQSDKDSNNFKPATIR